MLYLPALVVVLILVVGAAAVRLALADRRRASADAVYRAGRCTHCGYDVRATPGRCPDCGSDLFAQALAYWKRTIR